MSRKRKKRKITVKVLKELDIKTFKEHYKDKGYSFDHNWYKNTYKSWREYYQNLSYSDLTVKDFNIYTRIEPNEYAKLFHKNVHEYLNKKKFNKDFLSYLK